MSKRKSYVPLLCQLGGSIVIWSTMTSCIYRQNLVLGQSRDSRVFLTWSGRSSPHHLLFMSSGFRFSAKTGYP
jgi:hypothetical protein